jgi:hypothetical protein
MHGNLKRIADKHLKSGNDAFTIYGFFRIFYAKKEGKWCVVRKLNHYKETNWFL